MFKTAARPGPELSSFAWGALAVLLGIVIAQAPVFLVGGGLALAALGLVILIEPVLGLVLMLSVAPLKTLIATEASLPLPVDVGQLCLGLVTGAWLIWRVTRQRYTRLPRTRLYLPLAGFMLAAGLSLFGATSAGAWLSEMLKWAEMLLLIMIVLDLGQQGHWTWIAFGVVLAAGLQALIGLYEFRGGSGAPHLWIAGYRFFRAFGTFGQPNPFSAFMGLSLPLALGLAWGYLWKTVSAWRNRVAANHQAWLLYAALTVMYGGFSVLLLAGLLASWGRGAWMGFGAAAVVMVFFAPPRRWQGFALLTVFGGVFVMAWLMGFMPLSIQQRIENTTTEFTGIEDMRGAAISNENFAIVERLAHWQAAFLMASDRPLTGVGFGNYEVVYPDYGLISWPRALGHAHNDYLNLLAETGLIGLSAYLMAWAAIAAWTLRALNQTDPLLRGLVLGLLGTWTHLAVHSLVDKLYVNNLFLHIGVMLGLLAVAYQHHRRVERGKYA
ncbi:MAG: O-antigen ligase family protein [Anaerolineae bacterium]|nr:O-antigen ligase family protein [Anaerolineae bacterium]